MRLSTLSLCLTFTVLGHDVLSHAAFADTAPAAKTLNQAAALPVAQSPQAATATIETITQQISRADQAYAAGQWDDYQQIYQHLTKQSPERGEFWYRLGLAQLQASLLATSKPVTTQADKTQSTKTEASKNKQAITAFEQAAKLGYRPGRSYFQLAKLAASSGDSKAAVNYFLQARKFKLVNAEQELLGSPELMAIASEPNYQQLLWPALPATATAAAKWQADLQFLATRVGESAYATESIVSAVQQQLRALAATQSSDSEQNIVALMRILRQLASGHSQLYPPFQGEMAFHAAPIRLRWFADGLYVTAAAHPYVNLLGHKVEKIAGITPQQWLEQAKTLIAHDSDSGLKYISSLLMVLPEYSRALGGDTKSTALALTLQATPAAHNKASHNKVAHDKAAQQQAQSAPKEISIEAPALSMADLQGMVSSQLPAADWQAIVPSQPPLSARQPNQLYWFAQIANSPTFYWQLNQLRNDDSVSLAQMMQQLDQAMRTHNATGLIIDLRQNNGGNGEMIPDILQFLQRQPALQQPGRLMVLTSGRTFSAAALLAADLQALQAVYIGEPTGAGAVHIGEDNLVLLPNTGLAVAVATRLFVRSTSDDRQTSIAPHLQLAPSFAEVQAGQDPVLDAAIAQLKLSVQ